MNIAFLFNSGHPTVGGYYGPPVMNQILGTGVLQNVDRQMRVSIGDILTYGAVPQKSLTELCRAVYQPKKFDRLLQSRLAATHGVATIYCWLFQNMTTSVADAMHQKLKRRLAYLGAMDVRFSEPLHLRFFRNSLIEAYRMHGGRCSIFYTMGENADPDIVIQEIFLKNNFSVEYEDSGARRTIFDDYDTLEHFRRVEDFKRVFAEFEGLSEDHASSAALAMEEVHPKLFDAFASAARAIDRAETEEDLAQAALSGRRLLEGIADYLVPPTDEIRNGRKLGKTEYKNRLWAYVEGAIPSSAHDKNAILNEFGKEIDKLVGLFNSGLHHAPAQSKLMAAFRDLVLWLTKLVALNPAQIRRPYLAYEDKLISFQQAVFAQNPNTDRQD